MPEAAESCEFTDQDNTIFECTLRTGLKFSDGSDLTAEDVVFSFERNVDIADPNGASSLLANMKSIEAKGDDTVVFNLKEPDATWPLLLTTGSFAIVPSDVYPADKLQPSDEVVGSGRYTLAEYQPGQQTVMEKNDDYQGDDPAKNDRVIIQYFDKASALKLAVENGDVDIAYRSLSPTDIDDLEGADGVNVVSGNGTEIRYLVFNLDLQPGDNDAQKLAIRQAAAQMIDRQSIADNVYNGTVQPLYSMIPAGRRRTRPRRSPTKYGEAPDVDAAKQTLEDAGVETPVPLEVWWTPSHYGAVIRRRVRGDQAPARRERPLRRDAEVDRVEPVLDGRVHRQVPDLPARLVPGLPGRRRLHVAVLPAGQLPEHPLRQPGDEQADRRGEGVDRPGCHARAGVRQDPEDRRPRTRRRSRSGRPTRWRRSATGSTESRRRSTRRSSSASG